MSESGGPVFRFIHSIPVQSFAGECLQHPFVSPSEIYVGQKNGSSIQSDSSDTNV
jgi:hypothetical protein